MLRNNYYTLIGSLPALPRSFDEVERVPISRLKLIERLKMGMGSTFDVFPQFDTSEIEVLQRDTSAQMKLAADSNRRFLLTPGAEHQVRSGVRSLSSWNISGRDSFPCA